MAHAAAALLYSLRMRFRSLAIEGRASEVWQVLAAVKTEFGKFGNALSKVKKQLDTASRSIDETGTRTRAMERRLRDVEQLPEESAVTMLGLPAGNDAEAGLELPEDEEGKELPCRVVQRHWRATALEAERSRASVVSAGSQSDES